MNIECSHCGHAFETSEDLATCPKCEQVFEPIRPIPKTSIATKNAALDWTGKSLFTLGILGMFLNFLAGALIAIVGVGLIKFAEQK